MDTNNFDVVDEETVTINMPERTAATFNYLELVSDATTVYRYTKYYYLSHYEKTMGTSRAVGSSSDGIIYHMVFKLDT
jgi:hypothetical protein